jgi:hypothetical protein
MVFCFASGYCISTASAAVLLLAELGLQERAILVAPSPSDVLRDYLKLCKLWRGDDW